MQEKLGNNERIWNNRTFEADSKQSGWEKENLFGMA